MPWSQDGGEDGSAGATMTGSGDNTALLGSPTWTSDPVAVSPGDVLDLSVSVDVNGASSAPSVGVVYLGSAGAVLDTLKVITVPLTTDGFTTLHETITVPAGVAELGVVVTGFALTDLRTSGRITFDDVYLFGGT